MWGLRSKIALVAAACAVALCTISIADAQTRTGADNELSLTALMRSIDEGRWGQIAGACDLPGRAKDGEALQAEIESLQTRFREIMGEEPPSGFLIIDAKKCWPEKLYRANLHATRENIQHAKVVMDSLRAPRAAPR